MLDIQTISVVIAATSVVVGVVTFIMNSRKEAKLREDQWIIQRFQTYGLEHVRAMIEVRSATDWDTLEDFHKKYGMQSNNREWQIKFNYIFEKLNIAGIMLKRGADPELIFKLYMPLTIIHMWELYEPVTKQWRELTNDYLHREPFEYLYNEAKKRQPQLKPLYRPPER